MSKDNEIENLVTTIIKQFDFEMVKWYLFTHWLYSELTNDYISNENSKSLLKYWYSRGIKQATLAKKVYEFGNSKLHNGKYDADTMKEIHSELTHVWKNDRKLTEGPRVALYLLINEINKAKGFNSLKNSEKIKNYFTFLEKLKEYGLFEDPDFIKKSSTSDRQINKSPNSVDNKNDKTKDSQTEFLNTLIFISEPDVENFLKKMDKQQLVDFQKSISEEPDDTEEIQENLITDILESFDDRNLHFLYSNYDLLVQNFSIIENILYSLMNASEKDLKNTLDQLSKKRKSPHSKNEVHRVLASIPYEMKILENRDELIHSITNWCYDNDDDELICLIYTLDELKWTVLLSLLDHYGKNPTGKKINDILESFNGEKKIT